MSNDGIMELPADAPIGKGYAEWAGMGDPTFEINLTPNRQDCAGVHGPSCGYGDSVQVPTLETCQPVFKFVQI
jgi:hypothetical protein